MMKKFFYLAFLLPVFCFGQNTMRDEMEVMKQMNSFRMAVLNKDSVSLSALLSDDVTYAHTNGLVQTKSQFIRAIMSREQDYKQIEPSDMKVRIYDNTAVVNLKAKISMLYSGNALDFSMNVLFVWIRKEGDWKIVARQSTKL
jgi:hypothetical protein